MSYKEFIKSSQKHTLDNSIFVETKSLFSNGKDQYSDIEKAKEYVSQIKSHTIENLDFYLKEFETNFNKNGGRILWADTTQDAVKEIIKILKIFEVKTLTKSASSVIDEINFEQQIKNENIEIIETSSELNNSSENKKKQQIIKSDAGISGVNFLISDIGGLVLIENEGNIFLSSASSKIHIYVSTIEKIIPSINDLGFFINILSSFSTGQKITSFNTIITSQQKINELDGSERIYLVLLNNNRTNILNTKEQFNALKCIKCGACSTVCPIFKTVGKETYKSLYYGPIGSIIMPYIKTVKEFGHLSFASTLCGACNKICPVKIPLDKLLIFNRASFLNQSILPKKEILKDEFKNFIVLKRNRIDSSNGFVKNFIFKNLFSNYWGKTKINPRFYKNSFSHLYKNDSKFY